MLKVRIFLWALLQKESKMISKLITQLVSLLKALKLKYRQYRYKRLENKIYSGPGQHVQYIIHGNYRLTITRFKTGPNSWAYTEGVVTEEESGEEIARVRRNYSSFWYTFVLGHNDGHDYLLCGENYQGQTVIQLDTHKRVDYLPTEAKQGWGFCWADAQISPDKDYLLVDGCYWAAPYQLNVYNFKNPMELPYKQIEVCDEGEMANAKWNDDSTISYTLVTYDDETNEEKQEDKTWTPHLPT